MKKNSTEIARLLEAINRESAREKSIHHGHSSARHLGWARQRLSRPYFSLDQDIPGLEPTILTNRRNR